MNEKLLLFISIYKMFNIVAAFMLKIKRINKRICKHEYFRTADFIEIY